MLRRPNPRKRKIVRKRKKNADKAAKNAARAAGKKAKKASKKKAPEKVKEAKVEPVAATPAPAETPKPAAAPAPKAPASVPMASGPTSSNSSRTPPGDAEPMTRPRWSSGLPFRSVLSVQPGQSVAALTDR